MKWGDIDSRALVWLFISIGEPLHQYGFLMRHLLLGILEHTVRRQSWPRQQFGGAHKAISFIVPNLSRPAETLVA